MSVLASQPLQDTVSKLYRYAVEIKMNIVYVTILYRNYFYGLNV